MGPVKMQGKKLTNSAYFSGLQMCIRDSSYAVPVSVFITVGGGVYFLYLLVARKKV